MALQICQLNHRHPACPTCRFSMQNWCPYMSMADRKMDSTWLCRSSYEGRWEAMRTCRARSATLALVVLLSCVSSVRMAMSSSVRVGSRPHSWSYREKLGTNILIMSGLESQIKCKCFIISQLLLHLTIHWLKTTKQSFILNFLCFKILTVYSQSAWWPESSSLLLLHERICSWAHWTCPLCFPLVVQIHTCHSDLKEIHTYTQTNSKLIQLITIRY